MIDAIVFLCGFIAGGVTLGAVILYHANEYRKKLDLIDEEAADAVTADEVKQMFAEIHEITEEQLALLPYTESPSASASHSHHKNKTVRRIKALEERKVELFRQILDAGVDPVITMYIDGESKQIKMSEALKLQDAEETPKTPPEKTDSNPPHKDARQLTLVKNEENSNDTGDPKIP
jgi:hypothetical protein